MHHTVGIGLFELPCVGRNRYVQANFPIANKARKDEGKEMKEWLTTNQDAPATREGEPDTPERSGYLLSTHTRDDGRWKFRSVPKRFLEFDLYAHHQAFNGEHKEYVLRRPPVGCKH